MNKDKNIDEVILIIKKVLNVGNVTEQSNQIDFDEWDSMSYLSIVMEIEKHFNIEINENNLNNFYSVKSICNEIKNAK